MSNKDTTTKSGPDSKDAPDAKKIEYWPDTETEKRLTILRELLSEEDSSTSYRSAVLSRWISELDAKTVDDMFTVEVSDDEIIVTPKEEE